MAPRRSCTPTPSPAMQLTYDKLAPFLDATSDFATRARIAEQFLGGLAPFVLTDAARQAANISPPTLPDAAGSAWPLLAWKAPWRALVDAQLFAEAFALPLQWLPAASASPGDDPRLPAAFADMANRVRAALPSHRRETHTLHLAPRLQHLDLRALDLQADSAFVPLAAALYLRQHDILPDTAVFTTGAWLGSGIEAVGDIPAKYAAAAQLCPHREWAFFVPDQNADEPGTAASPRVHKLPAGTANLLTSLQPLLIRLASPPPPDADLPQRLHYANTPFVAVDAHQRQRYYATHLVDDLAQSLRRQNPQQLCRLAVAVSLQPLVTRLIVQSVPAQERAYLCSEASLRKLQQDQPALFKRNDAVFVLRNDNAQAICDDIAQWLQSAPSAVNITPGTSEMTAVLLTAAQRAKAQVHLLRHDFLSDPPNAQRYGSEHLDVLDWTTP